MKRVVITSSCNAVYDVKPEDRPKTGAIDERTWTDLTKHGLAAYPKSKTMAEQAAWKFQKSLPENERFDIVTINPGLLLGRALVPMDFGSGVLIKKYMLGKYPIIPKVMTSICEVQAAAEAHLKAVLVPEAANNRFILANRMYRYLDIAIVLNKEFGPHGYNIPTREMACYGQLYLLSKFKTEMKPVLEKWAYRFEVSNKKSREILGIEYGDLERIICDMGHYLIEQGDVPNLIGKQPQKSTWLRNPFRAKL